MIFGYARVSTKDQEIRRQIDALEIVGCDEIVKEKVSGVKTEKPELDKLINKLRDGDILVVDSIDRLGRTSKELIKLLDYFKDKNIHFRSLKEGFFDTTSVMGEAIFKIIAVLKEMEVKVLSERTMEGLKAARKRGKVGGRKKGSYNKTKALAAAQKYKEGMPISEILETIKIGSKSTLYQYLRNEGVFPLNEEK